MKQILTIILLLFFLNSSSQGVELSQDTYVNITRCEVGQWIRIPYQLPKPIVLDSITSANRDSSGVWTIKGDATKIIEYLYQFLMERQGELNKEMHRRNEHRSFDASQSRVIDDLREKLRKKQWTIDSLTQLSQKDCSYITKRQKEILSKLTIIQIRQMLYTSPRMYIYRTL